MNLRSFIWCIGELFDQCRTISNRLPCSAFSTLSPFYRFPPRASVIKWRTPADSYRHFARNRYERCTVRDVGSGLYPSLFWSMYFVRDSHSQCTVKYAVAIINSKHGNIKYSLKYSKYQARYLEIHSIWILNIVWYLLQYGNGIRSAVQSHRANRNGIVRSQMQLMY